MREDDDGFDAFVATAGRQLMRAAWVLTGDWHAAEDLVQGALERSWPRWSGLGDGQHRLAYVRRVMTTSYLRGARRRWTAELPTEHLPEPLVDAGFDSALVSATLRAAAARLPPKQRACVALRYFLDLSEADTATAMSCSVGTVKSNTARALDSLRGSPVLVGLLTPERPALDTRNPIVRVVASEPNEEVQ